MTTRSLLVPARYLSRAECEAITKRALSFASADETRVLVNSSNVSNTRFAVNQISTGGDAFDSVVTVISRFGKRIGSSSTNQLDDDGLRAVVQTSERVAKLSPEDPEAMPELGPQTYRAGVNWSEATASLDPEARARAVKQIAEPAKTAGLVSTGFMEAITGADAIEDDRGYSG